MKNNNALMPDPDSFQGPYFFFSNNPDADLTYISPSVEQVLGFKPSELVGRKYTDFLDANSPLNDDIESCRSRRFGGINDHHQNLRVVLNRNREVRVLQVQTYGSAGEDGVVTTNHGIAQDVTDVFFVELEMTRRLRSLRESEAKLSERESTVLHLVMSGRLNKSIAKEIGITERAIERIRSRLMDKFEAKTTAELVSKATELKVLQNVVLLAQSEHRPQGMLTPSRLSNVGMQTAN